MTARNSRHSGHSVPQIVGISRLFSLEVQNQLTITIVHCPTYEMILPAVIGFSRILQSQKEGRLIYWLVLRIVLFCLISSIEGRI